MLSFGTVFRYHENYYVYLVEDEDLIYTARILDIEITKDLIRERKKADLKPTNKSYAKPIYSFVVLTTENFKDRAALYGVPSQQTAYHQILGNLNEEDKESLERELLSDSNLTDSFKEMFKASFGAE